MSTERSMLHLNNALIKGHFSYVPEPFHGTRPACPEIHCKAVFESFTHKTIKFIF